MSDIVSKQQEATDSSSIPIIQCLNKEVYDLSH